MCVALCAAWREEALRKQLEVILIEKPEDHRDQSQTETHQIDFYKRKTTGSQKPAAVRLEKPNRPIKDPTN